MPLHVLIIEDSEDDAELTLRSIRQGGYAVVSRRVETAPALREALAQETWDIIISDYSMPQFNAPTALEILNASGLDIPFIIVSGTIGEDTAVTSLLAGARDFLVKGRTARLIPAIERELREAQERHNRKRAEMELAQSEERFAKAFQMSPTAISISRLADGVYLDVNESFLELVGLERDAVVGHSIVDAPFLISPDDRETVRSQLLETNSVTNFESVVGHSSGEVRNVVLSSEVIDISDTTCALSLFHDITDRKRAETAIRKSEERFRLLAENSTDMITRQAPNGVYLYVSPSCATLLGYKPEEIIGRSAYEFIHPEDRDNAPANPDAEAIQPETTLLTYRMRRKDGEYIWLETTRRTIRKTADGPIVEIQTASRDVSDRKHADEILRQSEERFRLLVQGVEDYAIYLLDTEGCVASWNAGAERLTGYSEKDVIGRNLSIFFTQEDIAAGLPDQLIEQTTDTGHVEYEGWRLRQDGSRFWADSVISSLRNDDGSLYGFSKIVRDLTARKESEETLRRYNTRLTMLHTIDQAILTSQTNETVIQFALLYFIQEMAFFGASLVIYDFDAKEAALASIYRHDPEPKSSRTQLSLADWTPEDLEQITRGTLQLFDDVTMPSHLTPELEALRAAGFDNLLRIPLVVQNQLIGALSLAAGDLSLAPPEYRQIAQEIATQLAIAIQQTRLRDQIYQYTVDLEQRVEERTADLNHAKERVEAILNNSSDAILFLSVDGVVQQVNTAFRKMFGYTSEETFSHSLLTLVVPDSAAQLSDIVRQSVETGRSTRLDLTARRQNGSTFYADVALAIVRNDSVVPGLVCSIRDITERKRAEDGLRQALEKERELNELKSRFVSIASHEFRTPLASILSAANILTDYRDRLDEKGIDDKLNRISHQVQYLASIINDVLDLGRLQSGRSEFKPAEFDLNALCETIIDEFESDPNNQHEYRYTCKPTPLWATLDEKLIRQVIINLISNATKYSGAGKAIFTTIERIDDTVQLQVRDQGIGIPEADLKHLFEPFHRAGNVGSISGTGLGLSIIEAAVELHGGSVTVESEVGQGTTFTIRVPVRAAAPQSDESDD